MTDFCPTKNIKNPSPTNKLRPESEFQSCLLLESLRSVYGIYTHIYQPHRHTVRRMNKSKKKKESLFIEQDLSKIMAYFDTEVPNRCASFVPAGDEVSVK